MVLEADIFVLLFYLLGFRLLLTCLRSFSARFVASIVGKIISLSSYVGNISLIVSRFLQSAVTFRDARDTPLDLSRFQFYPQCLDEINFWLDNVLSSTVGSYLSTHGQFLLSVLTLTSAFACGAHALFVDKEEFELF